ncbi:Uncharacterized protein Rs2_46922 [Raphanus sativus]|nr:Uncharacterized protein Rs2_46922 [Raphanus sativus]
MCLNSSNYTLFVFPKGKSGSLSFVFSSTPGHRWSLVAGFCLQHRIYSSIDGWRSASGAEPFLLRWWSPAFVGPLEVFALCLFRSSEWWSDLEEVSIHGFGVRVTFPGGIRRVCDMIVTVATFNRRRSRWIAFSGEEMTSGPSGDSKSNPTVMA